MYTKSRSCGYIGTVGPFVHHLVVFTCFPSVGSDSLNGMTAVRSSTVQGLINIYTAAYNDSATRLAACSADGKVNICDKSEDQQLWRLSSTSPTEGTQNSTKVPCPDTSLLFAPHQLGPQLAAASEDGFVRFYEASRPLNADRWHLSNDFQVLQLLCTPIQS